MRELGFGIYTLPAEKVQAWRRILIAEVEHEAHGGNSRPRSREEQFLRYAKRVKRTRKQSPT